MSASIAKHILVVDDDPKVRLLLRRCFEEDGYRVSEACTEGEVLQARALDNVDLITLDLSLGSDDGLTIARTIRARSNTPIIMITGKGDMVDRVVGLELGADDYISKPFHVREVLARVRSVIRRADTKPSNPDGANQQSDGERYSFGDWTANFSSMEITNRDGRECELTTADFKLLEVFVKHPKRVLSRDQLMDHLKGHDWSPLDRSIDNQVVRLRRKIEHDPKKPALIKTVRGAGYSFAVEVHEGG